MIVVISQDAQLQRLSREVLADLGREDLLASPGLFPKCVEEGDICLLDWSEDTTHDRSRSPGKGLYLYVVDREQVNGLPSVLPTATIGFLLKPINRSALRLSLEQAIDASANRPVRGIAGGDRDDMLQSLLHAYLRLQEHENDRATFLARVLHDFRAPLTAINGYCGLFLEEALGPLRPKQRDAVMRMHRSANRLSRLAISLFELTLHDRLPSELRMTESSIRMAVEEALNEVRPTSQDRDIGISADLEEPEGRLLFDAAQIEQVVVNLLENAIRFTPRRGTIELNGYSYCSNGEHTPNSYRIDLRDYGPQISGDVLPLIFEEYYGHNQTCDRSSGGLGLAMCKLIVRAHSGTVWATSGSEGTVFSFVLPFRSTEEGPQAAGREVAAV
jgi:signal transduction histidine kinase